MLQRDKPFVLPQEVQIFNNIPAFGKDPLPPAYVKWAVYDRSRFPGML